ncbi:MAG: transpeptidase family protein [Bacteroidetes bacterium]|nr:transpeptidase family protein [Bacteroidota bacterium]
MNIKNSILLRVRVAFIFVFLFGLVIIYKIVNIQVVQGDKWISMAERIGLQYRTVKATRGNILSDNGSLLATSLPFYRVAFDPSRASDELYKAEIDSLCLLLSQKFKDKSAKEYKRRINDARLSGRQYLILNRKLINYQQKKEMSSWPVFREGRIKGGVIFEKSEKRFHPFTYLANRTIGYINMNNQGAGLEYSFNQMLAGRDGKALYQKVAGGNWKPVFDGSEVRPVDGYDLETTIDINLQDVVESALLRALEKHNADYGSVVVMEVKTGEIKAISNLSKYSNGKYGERYNYAVGSHGLREPGSTFKLVTMIALFEENNIQLSDTIATGNGRLKIYDKEVKDHYEGGYGTITVRQAFELSSNVAMAKLADKYFGLKPEKFYKYIEDLGLTRPLGFQMQGEGVPKIKKPEDWSGITLPWMAHGYGLELTPLQTLVLYNGVANDGVMIKPVIVKRLYNADKELRSFNSAVLTKKMCSEQTLEKLKEILTGAVENGTAKNIYTPLYKIAGKTGTAVTFKNGKYINEYYTSFVGYFPADDPMYSCIVVIENPRGIYKYGNSVAAPVFREISDKIYVRNIKMHKSLADDIVPEKGIFPVIRSGNVNDLKLICNDMGISNHALSDEEWVKSKINNNSIDWRPNKTSSSLMPDVTGMTLRDAVFLLENRGVEIKYKGIGRVIKQSLAPGKSLKNHASVTLKLG